MPLVEPDPCATRIREIYRGGVSTAATATDDRLQGLGNVVDLQAEHSLRLRVHPPPGVGGGPDGALEASEVDVLERGTGHTARIARVADGPGLLRVAAVPARPHQLEFERLFVPM